MTEQLNPWVIVSSLGKDTSDQDLERIVPKIQSLVDNWQESGKIMWSGSLTISQAAWQFLRQPMKRQKDSTKNIQMHVRIFWCIICTNGKPCQFCQYYLIDKNFLFLPETSGHQIKSTMPHLVLKSFFGKDED